MINLNRLSGRFHKRKLLDFADDSHVQSHRQSVDRFLLNVLPEEELESVSGYFISDEAGIFDCSLADPEVLLRNCRTAYGVDLSIEDLRMPLHILVSHVEALSS